MAAAGSGLLIVGGHLIKTPTDLSTPEADGSYGGTILDTFQAFQTVLLPISDELRMGGYGNEFRDAMHLGFDVEIHAVLQNYGADGVTESLPNTAAPANAGDVRQVLEPGAVISEGDWLSELAAVLLWAPKNPDHPGLIAYNAIPFYQKRIVVDINGFNNIALDARWVATRHATHGKYLLADMADITAAGLP